MSEFSPPSMIALANLSCGKFLAASILESLQSPLEIFKSVLRVRTEVNSKSSFNGKQLTINRFVYPPGD